MCKEDRDRMMVMVGVGAGGERGERYERGVEAGVQPYYLFLYVFCCIIICVHEFVRI